MELLGGNTGYVLFNDNSCVGIDMVGTLKDFFEFILYWILIGTVTILFVIFMLGVAIVDLLMDIVSKITRSFKKHD